MNDYDKSELVEYYKAVRSCYDSVVKYIDKFKFSDPVRHECDVHLPDGTKVPLRYESEATLDNGTHIKRVTSQFDNQKIIEMFFAIADATYQLTISPNLLGLTKKEVNPEEEGGSFRSSDRNRIRKKRRW